MTWSAVVDLDRVIIAGVLIVETFVSDPWTLVSVTPPLQLVSVVLWLSMMKNGGVLGSVDVRVCDHLCLSIGHWLLLW